MVKFMKPGKIVVVLGGRYAGKKAVIVRTYDEGTKDRPYGYCVVVGIDKYPLKVTKDMGPKRVAKRTKIKPFIKVVNVNHLMPTRYSIDLPDLKTIVTGEAVGKLDARLKARKDVKRVLQDGHRAGKSPWFYEKLRF